MDGGTLAHTGGALHGPTIASLSRAASSQEVNAFIAKTEGTYREFICALSSAVQAPWARRAATTHHPPSAIIPGWFSPRVDPCPSPTAR